MALLNTLEQLSTQLQAVEAVDLRDSEDDEAFKEREEKLKSILADTCNAIAGDASYPNVDPAALQKADDLLNEVITAAYKDEFGPDFLPSFAHGDRPLVKDPEREGLGGALGAGSLQKLLPLLQMLGGDRMNLNDLMRNEPSLRGATKWVELEKPHAQSSPMARFRKNAVTVPSTITDAQPAAQAVFQARLATCSDTISSPISFDLPPESACLALIGSGGYKNRDPVLSCYLLDDDSEEDDVICRSVTINPGLTAVAYDVKVDPGRKLVYVADRDRVKSYKYDVGEEDDEMLAVHTLSSSNNGPILLLEGGNKIIRGGRKGVEVWNVDALPTHGPKGTKRIGKGKVSLEDSWRDEPEEIERSTGAPADTTTALAEGALEPKIWSLVPNGQLVLAPKERYSAWLSDVEHGLKPITRFIGHGGFINGFSTSPEDAQSFLTTCDDGVVRLYDVRQPLPQISFDSGSSDESVSAALYVHVDGIPVVFTGGVKSQSVKVWDVRSQRMMYEVATGNNEVISLAWDAPRKSLYAATECSYMDRIGYRHGYRFAKIPNTPHNKTNLGNWYRDPEAMEEEDEEIPEDEDEDDEPDEEHGWPEQAWHDESAFGYAFDCGEHRIFKYQFDLNANPKYLPVYGDALPGDADSMW